MNATAPTADGAPAGPAANRPAIRLSGVAKRYDVYASPAHRLAERATGRRRAAFSAWALRGLDLEVGRGEAVGIVGRNGSGKSTLLQIVAGTTKPTLGAAEVDGRVSALLELGSGFDPEFTGRENVYVNGAINNIPRDAIDDLFDRIAEFANIGEYIDRPIKTYSSGMVVRLAFAAATAIDPDILIVDEALTVGDEAFQRKCISRMERMQAAGATVLLVSHSGRQIIEVCDRALLLDRGEKLREGEPKSVVAAYQKLIYAPEDRAELVRDELRSDGAKDADAHGTAAEDAFDQTLAPESRVDYVPNGAEIANIRLHDKEGRRVNVLRRGREYEIRYEILFTAASENVGAGTLIKTLTGVELASASTAHFDRLIGDVAPGDRVEVAWRFACGLLSGVYFVNAGCSAAPAGEARRFLHRVVDGAMFKVLPEAGLHFDGIVDLGLRPRVRKVARDGG